MSAKTMVIGFFVGVGILLAAYFIKPIWEEKESYEASDAVATKGKITIGVDNWVGYAPLCSTRMKKEMRQEGWILDCQDDKGDYASRMKKLQSGELDFAVATIDSYLLNSVNLNFPGLIVAVIDESKGGDSVVAFKDTIPNLDALKGNSTFRIAYTPGSPSHHLIKSASVHFGIPELLSVDASRKSETNGSTEAFDKLKSKKVDVAVLWEPEVSRALNEIPGTVKLIGTESTSRLIVDILLVSRQYSQKHPENVELLLRTYFKNLKYCNDHVVEFRDDICKQQKMKAEIVDQMLKGVAWVNLTENCQEWFGVNTEASAVREQGLADTIDSTIDILIACGDFKTNPLPNQDQYWIIKRSYVESLYTKGLNFGFGAGAATQAHTAATSLDLKFEHLEDAAWDKLKKVGTLKVEDIHFQSGSSALLLAGKEDLDRIMAKLKHYPTFRVEIGGHTDVRGDPEENKELSRERAEAVSKYLEVTYGMDPNRIRCIGFGGQFPLPREPGESDRSFRDRLRRVVLTLRTEVY